MSEKWFVRDRLNLEAEMIAQLKALAARDRLGAAQTRRPGHPGSAPGLRR